jgi:hypothetical protein
MALTKEQIKEFKAAEKEAEVSGDYRNVADEIAEAGDKEWAKKVYGKAEKNAKEYYDFIELANNIHFNLSDKKWEKKIYKKAEGKAEDCSDFINLADSILEKLGDKEWAKKVYEKAEKKGEDCSDFINLADSILEKLGDKEWAKKVYNKSEEKAESFREFRNLADCIHENLGDKNWAIKVYKKTEEKIEKFSNFRNLADSINKNIGDIEWVKKIYKKAEENAYDCDEYESLAESIRGNLGDKKWAKSLEKKSKELEEENNKDILSAVEGKSMNVRYMRVSFGDVDDERYAALACINHKNTCFIMVEEYGKFAYIQIGNYVKILGKTELEEQSYDDAIDLSFDICGKHLEILCNTNREEIGWSYGFMKSCWYGNKDGLEGLASISDAEEEVIEFLKGDYKDKYAAGFSEEDDGMAFCLMEVCSLAIKMSGDKVVCNGKTYKFKDVFNLMDGWSDHPVDFYENYHTSPPITPAVSKFRSKQDYFYQMCIWGIRHIE